MVPLNLREHTHRDLHIRGVVCSVDKINCRNRVQSSCRPKLSLGFSSKSANLAVLNLETICLVNKVVASPSSINSKLILLAVRDDLRLRHVVQVDRRRRFSLESPAARVSAWLSGQAGGSRVTRPDSARVTVKVLSTHRGQVIPDDRVGVFLARSSRYGGSGYLREQCASNFEPNLGIRARSGARAPKRVDLVIRAGVKSCAVTDLITGEVVKGVVVSPAVNSGWSQVASKGIHHATLVITSNVSRVWSLPGNESALLASLRVSDKVGRHDGSALIGPPASHVQAVVGLSGVDGQVKVVHHFLPVAGSGNSSCVVRVALKTTVNVDGRTEAKLNSDSNIRSVRLPESSDGVVHTGLRRLRHHVEPESGGNCQPALISHAIGVAQENTLVVEHDS